MESSSRIRKELVQGIDGKDKRKSKNSRTWCAFLPSCLPDCPQLWNSLSFSSFLPSHLNCFRLSFLCLIIIKLPLGATPSTPSDTVGSSQPIVEPRFKVGPARENLSPIGCPYVIRSESIWGFGQKTQSRCSSWRAVHERGSFFFGLTCRRISYWTWKKNTYQVQTASERKNF